MRLCRRRIRRIARVLLPVIGATGCACDAPDSDTTETEPSACGEAPARLEVIDDLGVGLAWERVDPDSGYERVESVIAGSDGSVWFFGYVAAGIRMTNLSEDGRSEFTTPGYEAEVAPGPDGVFLTNTGEELEGFRLSSYTTAGTESWSRTVPFSFGTNLPVYSEGRVILPFEAAHTDSIDGYPITQDASYLLAFDAGTGELDELVPFSDVSTIAPGPDGAIVVLGYSGENHVTQVVVLEPDLTIRWQREVDVRPFGARLAVGPTGNIFVVEVDGRTLLSISATGEDIFDVSLPDNDGAAGPTLAALSDGGVLVALYRRVYHVDETGAIVGEIVPKEVRPNKRCPKDPIHQVSSFGDTAVYVATLREPDKETLRVLQAGRFAP